MTKEELAAQAAAQAAGEMPTTPPAGETPAGDAPDAANDKAELEEVRAALKRANAEAAKRRKALDAFEKADEERKLEAMSELEKLQAKLTAAQDRAVAVERDARQAKINGAVALQAAQMSFHDPADAQTFLGSVEFEVNEAGKVEGVEAALNKLAEDRPYLVKTASTQDPDARKRGASTEQVVSTEQAEINRRYGIRDPVVK